MNATKICAFLLSTAVFVSSNLAHGAIMESEPNDTLATADVIARTFPTFADVGFASLAPGGDVDVFEINLVAGDFLLVNTAGIAGIPPGSAPDTVAGLFDSSGTLLEVNDDAFGFGSNFTFFVPSDGTYSIAVTGFPDGAGGTPGDTFGDFGIFDGSHTESGPYILTVSIIPIPEPSTLLLASSIGLLAMGMRRRSA